MPELDLAGRTLGRYQIIAPLGSGGMAVVYRARQTDLDRIVALKILPPELGLDKSYIARFMQEARSAAALEHPHIVPIYDVGTAEGLHYIAMKYIQGETLKELALREGALDVARAAGLLEQVAGALDYAHANGIIHRDIKPSNMMVDRSGWVYLTDFGLARTGGGSGGLTIAGTVMGTPEYMSPEQAQGLANLGPPSDIYALGIVLYELLTGRMPFRADTPMGMLVARLQQAPTPPRDYRSDLPLPVEDVIMRALARKPEARYQSASELIAALKRAAGLGSQPLAAPLRPDETPGRGVAAADAHTLPRTPYPPAQMAAPPVQPAAPAQLHAPAAPQPATPAAAPTIVTPPPAAAPAHTPPARQGAGRLPLLLGAGVIVLLLLVAGLVVFGRMRSEAAVAERLDAGRAAFERPGGLDDAIAAYQEALELRPGHPEASVRLALIHLLRDRYQDAQALSEEAIDADDDNALAHAVLAEALVNQGEREEALEAAEEAISLDPEQPVGYAVRAVIKADEALETDDEALIEEALADAEQSIRLAAGRENLFQAMAYNARGYVYWQYYLLTNNASMADRSGDDFNRAIGLQPQIAVFHSNLGYFYNSQGEQALSRGDEEGAHAKLDLARIQFERAQEADPEYGHAHAGLGWNLYYLQDYTGALGEFDKALALNPANDDAYVGKARVYLDQPEPDYEAAIEALGAAVAVAPSAPVFVSLGWAHMSWAFVQEGEPALASYAASEESFRRALQINERSVEALTGLGWALRGRAEAAGDADLYDEAIAALEQAIEINPKYADAHFGLGWASYGLGEYEQAELSFRHAVELAPNDGGNHYWLGLALREQGRVEEARAAFEEAVRLGNPFAQEALDTLE